MDECGDTAQARAKKISRGAPLRGRGTPAIPARLRSERARNSYCKIQRAWSLGLRLFASPEELVSLDRRYNAYRALFSWFGTLHPAQATDPYRTSQCDFVG